MKWKQQIYSHIDGIQNGGKKGDKNIFIIIMDDV